MKVEIEWIPIVFGDDGQIISVMPNDGEEVLVSFKHDVAIDTCFKNGRYYFDTYCDEDIKAWAYLPKPYKEE
jgi:hypothetical protein